MHRSTILTSRNDVSAYFGKLWAPLQIRLTADGPKTTLGPNAAYYGIPGSYLEAFARPLWGLIPALEEQRLDQIAWIGKIWSQGTDPGKASFWGVGGARDARYVEYGALAFALLGSNGRLWDALDSATRNRTITWLGEINHAELNQNNWVFFRLLVNAALRNIGATPDRARELSDWAQIDNLYGENGWFRDGPTGTSDYYVAMAFHFYSLILLKVGVLSADRRQTIVERAKQFAPQYAAWFSSDGGAIPYGRSLTYRFAFASFWGALAYAGVEALPWGCIRTLYLRHLNWWRNKPICSSDGLLTQGYAYPNLIIGERYNSAASPYWAFKAFLPLALDESHPFWCQRAASVDTLPEVQRGGPGIVCSADGRKHIWLLSNSDRPQWLLRHGSAKYSKFAYSSHFGFGVGLGGTGPESGAGDSNLLLTADGLDWRGRSQMIAREDNCALLYCAWQPFGATMVESWQVPIADGALRVHRISTRLRLRHFESGFGTPIESPERCHVTDEGLLAAAGSSQGVNAIKTLMGERRPVVYYPEPNTNVLHPLVAVPGVEGILLPGEHWLVCATFGRISFEGPEQVTDWAASVHAASNASMTVVSVGSGPIPSVRVSVSTEVSPAGASSPNQPRTKFPLNPSAVALIT